MRRLIVLLACVLSMLSPAAKALPESATAPATVVLLHGLARQQGSMAPMARALRKAGYRVCNLDYPSRQHTLEVLAAEHVYPAIRRCQPDPAQRLHFVTHSLGGIVLRQLVRTTPSLRIGRVVMLSPPNAGSEIVDLRKHWPLYRWINGPAGQQLGTQPSDLPAQLGPATFELGVLTGSRSINWILSSWIPGTDDGKVAVARAALIGMRDFHVLPATHTFIMRRPDAQAQTLHFLMHGHFRREG